MKAMLPVNDSGNWTKIITLFMCTTLFLAVIVFNRVERNFMDTV